MKLVRVLAIGSTDRGLIPGKDDIFLFKFLSVLLAHKSFFPPSSSTRRSSHPKLSSSDVNKALDGSPHSV